MSRDGRLGRRWSEFVPGQAPLFTRDRLIIVGIVLMLAFFGYLTERQLHRADAAGAAAAARATDPSMALYTPAAPVIVPEILPTEALPSGVPTIAASDLPPPPPVPPQAVLKAEGDSVLAAPEPSPMPAPKRKPGPVLIFDAGASSDAAEPEGARVLSYSRPAPAGQASGKDVALLTRGTLIPAVLESVIDTRQPGGVRAMVSTDVRSADGARLLVPRTTRQNGQ
jgi:type IV secretion system protein VirB10